MSQQYPGPQHPRPQHPGPHYTGSQYTGSQYTEQRQPGQGRHVRQPEPDEYQRPAPARQLPPPPPGYPPQQRGHHPHEQQIQYLPRQRTPLPPPLPLPPAPSWTEPAAKRRRWPWVIGGIVLLLVVIGSLGNVARTTTAAPATDSSGAAPAAPTTLGNRPIPTLPEPAPEVPAAVPAPPPAPAGPARELTSREWALIAKSPDGHVGEHVVVFGYVSQFDPVTGGSAFRASIDGVRHDQNYEYDTNAILAGRSTDQLTNVVVDDEFRAEVTIAGSFSYETTMGGTLTVPQLRVEKIEVV